MDVTRRVDVAAAVTKTIVAFGSINVADWNTGVIKPEMFMDNDEENWNFIMYICTKSVFPGMQEVARRMIAQGPMEDYPFKLIPIGSILSHTAFKEVIPYACSQYGETLTSRDECGIFGP